MIIPDANLLLYAYDKGSPFHQNAAEWWIQCMNGMQPIGLCPAVVFAFIRLGTNPKAFRDPLTIDEATDHVQSWLNQSITEWIESRRDDFERTVQLLRESGSAGSLTTDAQIAAIAIRCRATVHTADTDFQRFRGVRWHNPLMTR